jgi:hypothetical protein
MKGYFKINVNKKNLVLLLKGYKGKIIIIMTKNRIIR